MLEQMGERAVLASTEGHLAQVALMAGRDAEAARIARRCAALATEDDASPQALWRQVSARVLARQGKADQALELAGEAVDIVMATDHLNEQADALVDLALVNEAAERPDEAAAALLAAGELYDAKGNLVRAGEVRRRLASPVGV